MNCERCKNKKATLFYADEGGVRHALCAACGASRDKLGNISEVNRQEESIPNLPCSLMIHYEKSEIIPYITLSKEQAALSCKGCGATAETITQTGEIGCPLCFEVFEKALADSPLLRREAEPIDTEARMPRSIRERINRETVITQLKQALKSALDCEDYESAAVIRDKIRELEINPRKKKITSEKKEN